MNILIIDKMHDSILPLLQNIGSVGDYQPNINREEVLAIIHRYEGLIVRSKTPIDAELLSKAPNLKFVGRAGAGIDNVDMEAMNRHNIQLLNAPEGNRDAVAEHTLGLILNLFNKISQADQQIRKGIWDREGNRGVELKGKTVGVLGYGYMGEAVVQRLKSFDCKILIFDLQKAAQFELEHHIELVDFQVFCENVEVLSIHIPLNELNYKLIDRTYLKKFNKLAYIVNTSRGEILDLASLVELLEKGEIKGAALDVLANEKFDTFTDEEQVLYNKLFTLKQVLLSPHVAGWTHESYEKINKVLIEKIKNIS